MIQSYTNTESLNIISSANKNIQLLQVPLKII
jgi:hypothetical protein